MQLAQLAGACLASGDAAGLDTALDVAQRALPADVGGSSGQEGGQGAGQGVHLWGNAFRGGSAVGEAGVVHQGKGFQG